MPQIKVRGINENDICKISEKMIDELSKSRYSSIALVMVSKNIRQEK